MASLEHRLNRLFALGGDQSEKEEEEVLWREELELDTNCDSKWYKWCRLELETYLKLTSLKLNEEPSSQTAAEIGGAGLNTLRLQVEDSSSDPPSLFGRSRPVVSVWRCRYVRPLCRLVLAYFIIKFTLLAFLSFKRDASIKSWKPILRPNAVRHDSCTLASEPHLEHPALLQTIKWLNEWIHHSGSPYRELIGAPIMIFQFIVNFTVVLYLFGQILIRWTEPRVDYLNFVTNPHGERARISRELDKIVGKLVQCLEGHPAVLRLSQPNVLKLKGPSKHVLATEYIKLLVGIHHLVKPANLTARWHKTLTRLCCCYTPLMLGSQMAGFGASGTAIVLEMVVRAAHRLDKLKCQRWMPNGVLIKDAIELQELREKNDIDAYSKLDYGFLNLLKLAFSVEYKFLVTTPSQVLYCIELSLFMLFTCIIFPTYELLYWWCVVDKIKWLRQVEEQLDCCVDLCESMNQTETEEKLTDVEEKRFISCLTITYLNYRLFYSQQPAFMTMASIFIGPMVIGASYMILLSYFINTQTESLFSRIIVFGIGFFCLQCNFYMVTGALFLSKAQRMMKTLLKLMGISTGGSSNRRIIIDLWRRQLLKSEHLEMMSGVKVFGWPLSYGLLTEFNFYFLIICAVHVISEHRLQ